MGEKGLAVPLDYEAFHRKVKQFKDEKDWINYFGIKEFFVDLRDLMPNKQVYSKSSRLN